jgi:hypothetical protein
MDTGSICVAWMFGVIYAGVIGWLLFQMKAAQLKMGHGDRALDKFPDSAQPDLTARKLMRTSQQARLAYILCLVALLLVFASCPALLLFVVLPAMS